MDFEDVREDHPFLASFCERKHVRDTMVRQVRITLPAVLCSILTTKLLTG